MHECCPWNAFNKFVIVYYKTSGTAFAAILKHLFYLVFFIAKHLRLLVWKIGPDGVKRHKGSLASRLSQDQGWIFYLGLVMALQLNKIKT